MKIAICIPCHGSPKLDTMFSLSNLLITSLKAMPALDLELHVTSGSVIADSRRKLLLDAMFARADGILWIDADQSFPPDALLRLLARNLKAVGCNYPRKSSPFTPTATRVVDGKPEPVYSTEQNAKGLPERVTSLGLGFFLIHVALVRKMAPPYFAMPFDATEGRTIGEDEFFCQSIRDAGEEVYVDHALSLEIGHVGEATFDYRHALAVRHSPPSK